MGYLKLARILGPLIVIALLTAWALRLNNRRAYWQDITVAVTSVLGNAVDNPKLKPGKAVETAREVVRTRDQYQRERDSANQALVVQGQSILDAEVVAAKAKADAARAVLGVKKLTEQRDIWIAKARAAATPTERLTCEQELANVEETLDALRNSGF